ncbi:uncharacterized protein LOC129949141 [Eupeodes corollae]|uniref:uncharacterized protein LOC129949141 n=1 Tax=Eupeodes corollae TaxID=290404 RepID=UPI002493AED9|nr:uncharacterized protein LOC129949141 [Eupeodes corollae]
MNSQSEHDLNKHQDPDQATSLPNVSIENITSEQNDSNLNNDTELIINKQTSVYVIDSTGRLSLIDMNSQNFQETNDRILNSPPQISQGNQNDDLASLLKSFNLYDELYTFLKGKHINVEGLKYIQKHHMDKLFEGFDNFNTRIVFEHKLGIWQSSNGIFNLSSQSTLTNQSIASWIRETNSPSCSPSYSPSSNSNASESDIMVFDILNKTEQGKALITNYKKNNNLKPEDRTNVVRKIIQHYTENNKNLSVKGCAKLAEQIVSIFPTEQKATYYVPGVKRGPPKGKLYDRYRGQRRAMKKLGVYECPSTSNAKKTKVQADVVEEDINKDSLSEVELLSIFNQLKHNRNWEIVLPQWVQTVRLRREMIDKNNDSGLSQIFLDWPLYKYSKAQELIEIDYKFMKPGKTFQFEKWEIFCRHALDFFSERIKTSFLKTYLHDFRIKLDSGMLDMDNINLGYVQLLHGVLTPAARKFQGKSKKFTIDDSVSAFNLEVKQAADIDSFLDKRREECLQQKVKLQPLIIVVGEKFSFKDFYVAIDNVKYKMQSYLECIDFYLKMTYVLNIEYPPQCLSVWTFIQIFLFEIDDGDIIPSVQTFINDILHS